LQDFKNVETWKKAHALTLTIYEETRSLPKDEMFGISFQLRRTAIAIAARISEGVGGRRTPSSRLTCVVLVQDVTNWSVSF
jgi:four helix bundle protein